MKLPALPWKRLLQAIALILLAIIIAGLAAPFLGADRYGKAIQASLEKSLGRQVEVGRVHFNLFTGPGFTVDDVVIHERPEYGIEPIAYVTQMDARIRLLSLWTGHLEFSTLRLIEPSLNLVRREGRGWNVQSLLEPALSAAPATSGDFPELLIRQGRLNFKFDDTKSIFYLTNADLDLSAASGRLELWFAGEPARTDRAGRGFGRFTARGRIKPRREGDGELDFDLELKQADLDELSQLMRGRAAGLHGLITARTTLKGPVANVAITGQAQIEDIHRWDLMPGKAEGWKIPLRGRIDLRAQNIDLDVDSQNAALPLKATLHASDLLGTPRWTWSASLDGLPVESLVEVSRHMGTPLPPQLEASGTVAGSLEFSSAAEPHGTITMHQLVLRSPETTPMHIDETTVTMQGSRYVLQPVVANFAPGQTATVEASYDAALDELSITASTRGLLAQHLREAGERILGAGKMPVISELERGTVNGRVQYQRKGSTAAPAWTGEFALQNSILAVAGLASPLRNLSGSVVLEGNRVVMRGLTGRAGTIELRGDYRYEPDATRPHQFNLSIAELDAAELERQLMPALRLRNGFLARTLRLGKAAEQPEWLAARHAEGNLRVGTLKLAGITVHDLRTHLVWDGPRIGSTGGTFQIEDSAGTFYFVAALRENAPDYRVGVRLKNLSWNTGKVDLDGVFTTTGTGAEVFQNLRSEGNFEARSLPGPAGDTIRTASGTYVFSLARGNPVVRLSAMQIHLGPDTYRGQGSTLADGRVQLDLTAGDRRVRWNGPWAPLTLEIASTP